MMATGTAKWCDSGKCFGFIVSDTGGSDAFAHNSALGWAGLPTLKAGQRVNFELHSGPNGKNSAEKIAIAE